MTAYPNSGQQYLANRLIRLLQKSCAANEIGIEACWLVTCVALVEDAKHYSGPVTFWTGQLLPITGFASWGRLDRARERAVQAGWLYYRPGTNRQCGVYWCKIPENVLRAFNDSPVDEMNHHSGDHQNGDSLQFNHQNRARNGERNVIETGSKRNRNGEPSIPVPVPVPKENGALLSKMSSQNFSDMDMTTANWMFDIVLRLQPKHKPVNISAWANDIRLMREQDGRTDAEIRELFVAADADDFWRSNIRSPAKLRKLWDNLDVKLRKSNGSGKQKSSEAETAWQNVLDSLQRHSRFNPDQIMAEVCERAWQALGPIGLKKLDEANDFERQKLKEQFVQNFIRQKVAA